MGIKPTEEAGDRTTAIFIERPEIEWYLKPILTGKYEKYAGFFGDLPEEGYRAFVPSDVRQILRQHGIIDSIYTDKNYEKYLWIPKLPYEYKCRINLGKYTGIHGAPAGDNTAVHLVFNGIDYDALISINGQSIARHTGMFSAFGITSDYKTVIKGLETAEISVKLTVQPWWRTHAVKCQMAFGWDFAPEIRTVGIWRPVDIYISGRYYFTGFTTRVLFHNGNANEESEADLHIIGKLESFDSDKKTPLKIRIMLKDEKGSIIFGPTEKTIHPDPSGYFTVNIKSAAVLPIWRPLFLKKETDPDYGGLIYFTAELHDNKGNILDIIEGRAANANVEWVRNPGGLRNHRNWTVKIGKFKRFMRGINWVPPDSIFSSISEEKYRKLIDIAAEHNIDMFRVWGGGILEYPYFYNYADEKGIMIWQEFPFACTNYPEHSAYLKIAEKECYAIAKRTCNHPSVVLYCGGNEFNPIINAHIIKITRNAVIRWAPDIEYTEASPYRGDDHNWRVWGYGRDFDAYEVNGDRVYALLSEFGVQALPDIDTFGVFLTSGGIDGNTEVSDEIEEIIRFRKGDPNNLRRYLKRFGRSPRKLGEWIKDTQRIQAFAIKYAVERCRSAWPNVSGVFPWQYTDPWPNVSWSVLDYYLRPKIAMAVLKLIYSPILPMVVNRRKSPRLKKGYRADIVIHNMYTRNFSGKLKLGISDKAAGRIIYRTEKKFEAAPDRCLKIGHIDYLPKKGTVIKMEIINSDNKTVSVNYDYPAMYRKVSALTVIRDKIDAIFDAWWRRHMTYLMKLERLREEYAEWLRKRRFYE